MIQNRNQGVATVLAAVIVLSVFAIGFSGTALAQESSGELTFDDQELADDGTVTVGDVSTGQASTVVVTYTDGDQEIVAGVANADNLDGESVSVTVEDAGGFPGTHTAWVFDDGDLPDDLSIGDDATPVAGAALDSDSATVSEQSTGELTFTDQELADDGSVTVSDVTTAQESTVVVTYTDGDQEVVAGVAAANNLDGESVSVTVEDTGGFPGEHTAWVFETSALPDGLAIGDDATPVAGEALASDSAAVSAPTSGELTFDDQSLADDGSVTVSEVSTSQESTVVVTYTDGDQEVVAGVSAANNVDDEDVSVTVEDAGGFPGTHTAWVFETADLPENLAIGDDATPIADAALDSDSAEVTEAMASNDTTDDGGMDGDEADGDSEDGTDTGTDDSGAGFGVVAALIALVAAATIALKRRQ